MNPFILINLSNRKYIFILFAIFSILFASVGYIFYRYEENSIRAEKHKELETISNLKVNQIVQWRKERFADATYLSQSPQAIKAIQKWLINPNNNKIKNNIKENFNLYINDNSNNNSYEDIYLASIQGDMFFSAKNEQNKIEKFTSEEIVASVNRKNKIWFDYYYCSLHKKIHFEIAAPVLTPNGNPIAVVVLRIDPNDYLYPMIQNWPTPSKTSETLVIERYGNRIVALNELRHKKNSALKFKFSMTDSNIPAVRAVLGYKGIFEGIDYRGVSVLSYINYIPATNWFIVSKVDKSEIYSDLYYRIVMIVGFTLLLILFSGVGFLNIYKSRQTIERKKMLTVLQAEKENLLAVFESSPVAMFVIDETTNIVMINLAFTVMCEGNESDILQHRPGNALRCVHSHTDPRGCGYAPACKYCNVRNGIEALIAGGGTLHGVELELELTRNEKPGKYIMNIGVEPFMMNGRVHWCIAMYDITERKHAEETINLNSQLMKTLLQLNQMIDATLQEITDFTLEESISLTQSKIGYLAFLNEDESVLNMHSWSKSAMAECAITDKPFMYPVVNTGLWGEAVRQRQAIITNDYLEADNPFIKGFPQGHVNLKRHMNTPVFDGSRMVIVAGVGNKNEEYNADDVNYLTLLMDNMWKLLERKKVGEALLLKNFVFDTSIAANSISDLNGNITEANDTFLRNWGYTSKDDVVGKPIPFFMNDQNDAVGIITALNNTGQWEGDFTAKRKDGSTFIAHGQATIIKDEKGKVISYQSSVNDISLQKEAEKELKKHRDHLEQLVAERTNQLQESNKELEAFSYSISHDLRTPLRHISGYIDLIQKEYSNILDGEVVDYFNVISSSANNMGVLIDDLLNFSRIGKADIIKTEVNANIMVNEVIYALANEYAERKIEWNVGILPDMFVDHNLIRQVWINLLSNAIKYTNTRETAVINIQSNEEDKEIIYSVSDNGVGFNMKYVDKLFGVFQRFHKAKDFEGTGIGLAIVRRIIARHGGSIRAEGEIDKGATFYFTIPKRI